MIVLVVMLKSALPIISDFPYVVSMLAAFDSLLMDNYHAYILTLEIYTVAIYCLPNGRCKIFYSHGRDLLLGCRMAIPVGKWVDLFILFYFSVSVKVLPVTPLLSGVFVYRAFCSYFLRIERVVEMRRFLWWTQ